MDIINIKNKRLRVLNTEMTFNYKNDISNYINDIYNYKNDIYNYINDIYN